MQIMFHVYSQICLHDHWTIERQLKTTYIMRQHVSILDAGNAHSCASFVICNQFSVYSRAKWSFLLLFMI